MVQEYVISLFGERHLIKYKYIIRNSFLSKFNIWNTIFLKINMPRILFVTAEHGRKQYIPVAVVLVKPVNVLFEV
jgi:hypothetical protein